jgi:alkylhydroperoxidase family enzyme
MARLLTARGSPRLRRDLDDAQLVELTMMIAVENQHSRFNSAFGLSSQGFKDRCPAAS